MPGSRFSLLLLEPGEIYFQDFSVTFKSDADGLEQRGRLRLCSKSIIFEPIDIKHPIIRINFIACTSIFQEFDGLIVKCSQRVEMLTNNIVAPYTFKKDNYSFKFSFHYATSEECFHRLGQLHRASSLLPKEHQEMMEAIVHSRHSRVNFDPLWLEDLHESIIFEARAVQVSPLVSNPGRVVLTSARRLYYQPYNSEPWPVLKVRFCEIDRVVRRRYLLQNSALEIYFKEAGTTASIKYLFLALGSQALCNELFTKLESRPMSEPAKMSAGLDVVTLQWQHGVISNFDYILYLNSMADRSFNDLTQYPVLPWVVTDYTSSTLNLDDPNVYRDLSLPVGALNSKRLKQLLERYSDMPEPRFLYGSHYLAPGFVLFYLARKHPQLVLCLHGGRFDHADRMFNSVPQTWHNVMNGAADYKELVPEFYDGNGEFLTNYLGVDFGRRSADGRPPVGDVQLPPWASSPQEFTTKLRQALESEHVSRNLHRWIDLIFGNLQTGPSAIQAHNLFHPLCYEGSVDLDSIRDPATRHMYEIQILEFGQIPRQLFIRPHPPRFGGLIPPALSNNSSCSSIVSLATSSGSCSDVVASASIDAGTCLGAYGLQDEKQQQQQEEERRDSRLGFWSRDNLSQLQLEAVLLGHKKPVTGVALTGHQRLVSVSLDGLLKVFKLDDGKQILSVNPCESSPLTACLCLPNSNTVLLGTLQNELAFYQIDCCRLDVVAQIHDDCITALDIKGLNEDSLVLASASSDCSVKLWRIRCPLPGNSNHFRFRPSTDLLAEMELDSVVVSLDFNPIGDRLATGTREGHLQLWHVPSGQLLHSLEEHSSEVSAVKFSPDGTKLVSAGRDGLLQVFQVDIDPPQTLARTLDTGQDFRCLVWDGLSVLLGTAAGQVLLFDLVEFRMVQPPLFVHQTNKTNNEPVTCLLASSQSPSSSSSSFMTIVSAGSDGRICLWRPIK